MKILLLLAGLFLLFLIDLPILSCSETKVVPVFYSFLMLVGFAIMIIVMEDLVVASPAVVIENLVKLILER